MTDDDRRAEHRHRDPVRAQQALHLAARAQVRRQGGLVAAEPAEVDDLPDPGVGGGPAEGAGVRRVLALEPRRVEGVDQVVGHVDALEGLAHGGGVADVPRDRPARSVVLLRTAGHRQDVVTLTDQGGGERGADEARRPGDEDALRGHQAPSSQGCPADGHWGMQGSPAGRRSCARLSPARHDEPTDPEQRRDRSRSPGPRRGCGWSRPDRAAVASGLSVSSGPLGGGWCRASGSGGGAGPVTASTSATYGGGGRRGAAAQARPGSGRLLAHDVLVGGEDDVRPCPPRALEPARGSRHRREDVDGRRRRALEDVVDGKGVRRRVAGAHHLPPPGAG